MMNLPVAFLCLYFGAIPESVIIVAIIISQCCLAARLYILRSMIGLNAIAYLKQVYRNIIIVTVISALLPYIISRMLPDCFINALLNSLITIICVLTTEYYVGCSTIERRIIYNFFVQFFNNYVKR